MSFSDPTGTPPPFEACVKCGRGDTPTAVAFQGEANIIVGALMLKLGLSPEEAISLLGDFFAGQPEYQNLPPGGYVPSGVFTVPVRLCDDCGEETETPVGKLPGEVPVIGLKEEGS